MDDFEKRISFLMEMDKVKRIYRQTRIPSDLSYENDAEHMWHMALYVMTLEDYSVKKININRAIKMVLLHDVIEIYAGDTYAYDEEGKKSQHERETLAAKKIFSILPEEQSREFRMLFEEFEAANTDDSLYANACDRLQPFSLNYSSGGKSWEEHGVFAEQVKKRMEPIRIMMPEIYEKYVLVKIKDAKEKGLLK